MSNYTSGPWKFVTYGTSGADLHHVLKIDRGSQRGNRMIVEQPRPWEIVYDPLRGVHRVKELGDEYEPPKDIQKILDEFKEQK